MIWKLKLPWFFTEFLKFDTQIWDVELVCLCYYVHCYGSKGVTILKCKNTGDEIYHSVECVTLYINSFSDRTCQLSTVRGKIDLFIFIKWFGSEIDYVGVIDKSKLYFE